MAVIITEKCVNCFSCLYECPVNAISDMKDNPEGKDIFYVNPNICVECVGYHDTPICAQSCSFDDTIIWGETKENITNNNVFSKKKIKPFWKKKN